MKSNSCFI